MVTEISVDRVMMDLLLDRLIEKTDALDSSLSRLPAAPDGGIASALITFLTTASTEASGLVADGNRALDAVARDVLDNFAINDASGADELQEFTDELENG